MAVVLNLVPVPPFDGYRVVAPFLNPEVRGRIDQASGIIMLAVFFLLWYVPVVNNLFWSVVSLDFGAATDTAQPGGNRFEPIPVFGGGRLKKN